MLANPEKLETPSSVDEPKNSNRAKGGRRHPPSNLPRQRVIIDLPEDQKKCSCGACKQVISEECSEQYQCEFLSFPRSGIEELGVGFFEH